LAARSIPQQQPQQKQMKSGSCAFAGWSTIPSRSAWSRRASVCSRESASPSPEATVARAAAPIVRQTRRALVCRQGSPRRSWPWRQMQFRAAHGPGPSSIIFRASS
jgi:hypothetical protein